MEEPKLIYKYRYFDKDGYHLDILRNLELYFASPAELNDPFDCKIPIRYDLASLKEIQINRSHHIKRVNPKLHPNQVEKIAQKEAKLMYQEIKKNYSSGLHGQQQFADNNFGICSFSKKKNHNALWSLYSERHTGFQIIFYQNILDQFFYERLKVLNDRPMIIGDSIKYHDEMPLVKPIINKASELDNSKKLFLAKSSDFIFEDEYRYLSYNEQNKQVSFPKNAIKEVVSGVQIHPTNLLLLKDICLDQGIILKEAIRNPHSFKAQY